MRIRIFKVGRDATSGRFMRVIDAMELPATTTVETMTVRSFSRRERAVRRRKARRRLRR